MEFDHERTRTAQEEILRNIQMRNAEVFSSLVKSMEGEQSGVSGVTAS